MEYIIETFRGLEIIDEKDTNTDMQKFATKRWKTRQAKYDIPDQISQKTGESKPFKNIEN
ncbi:MAG: hypothetical protein IPM71_15280 [Bacteroidota bacterium]|nr:MAG: hypothetical protein IPM71_15280 [Bacteroidota bacterium]